MSCIPSEMLCKGILAKSVLGIVTYLKMTIVEYLHCGNWQTLLIILPTIFLLCLESHAS